MSRSPPPRIYYDVKRLLTSNKWHEAKQLFEKNPDASSATLLISHANKSLGNLSLAFNIYNTVKASLTIPNCYLFTSLAYACQRLDSSHIASLWQDIEQYR